MTQSSLENVSAKGASMEQLIYFFGGGKAEGTGTMKDVLGGKGAGLHEMTNVGVPVPPGFTIVTGVCRAYHAHGRTLPGDFEAQQRAALTRLEGMMGRQLGDANDPLLVSVRSGAKFSMPGMMTPCSISASTIDPSWASPRAPAMSDSHGTATGASSRCSARW